MTISRRGLARATLGSIAASALAMPALADSEPVRIGWLAALTGPSSAPALGFDRGVRYAVEQINNAGGIKGRKIELVVRDTQGDPTKAVNAVQDMISRVKVHAIYGPTNSGEALATTPILARAKMPNMHAGFVDSLIDPVKYPNAFRMAPSNSQINQAVAGYALDIMKLKDIAVVGDTTGYAATAVPAFAEEVKKRGGNIVYQNLIDATQPDVMPDMLKMKNAKAQTIAVWSVSTGMEARLMNARATLNWDIAFIGHPAMGSGEVGHLVDKPQNWEKVYILGFRNCSIGPDGKLPPRTQSFVDSVKGKIELKDTTLWWVANGVDAINVIAKAVEVTGSTASQPIIDYWDTLSSYPGYYADYSWSKTQHNGFPSNEIVMSEANSQTNGAYRLAPGYKI
ncbi:MAG TPA: ABC transporter substrate-binding protein [Rhodopila sp.]|uniref:ABC transporter substrate-binding protein n=1 Tax=Rhodopila sp. TaxID=2480087 RepID=UPI002C06E8D8|nr:ABC transporter substrate-binding protein [Rhodopila sp.]HVY18091.1 ABC transporter substrate-binding protein [Rhodopila sp.]